ncbi:MAG: flagellar basal body P-ring protein FlgI, partial [Pseudomonadota bacterium]
FAVRGQASSLTEGVPTYGRISNGAVVEREITYDLARKQEIRLALRNPDLTTAQRVVSAINGDFAKRVGPGAPSPIAAVANPSTVVIRRPPDYPGNMVTLLSRIEGLGVTPDQTARVIIDEASGVIVIGDDVRVSTVAIAQGSLTISIAETPQVSQPIANFSDAGQTVIVPRTEVEAQQQDRQLQIVGGGVRLSELVDGLNALGVSPRDMISILQAIKSAGALQADIEVR